MFQFKSNIILCQTRTILQQNNFIRNGNLGTKSSPSLVILEPIVAHHHLHLNYMTFLLPSSPNWFVSHHLLVTQGQTMASGHHLEKCIPWPWPLFKLSCLLPAPPALSLLTLASLQALLPSYSYSPAFLNFPWSLFKPWCLTIALRQPSLTAYGLSSSPPTFLMHPPAILQALLCS